VTSVSVHGLVRFPLRRRLSRRDEERPQGDASVATPVPDLTLPTPPKARPRRPPQVDPWLRQAPAGRARPDPVQPPIALGIERLDVALRQTVPVGGWSSTRGPWRRTWCPSGPGGGRIGAACARRTGGGTRRACSGGPLKGLSPSSAVAERVSLLPAHASRPVSLRAPT
jgi:hypothetical protein